VTNWNETSFVVINVVLCKSYC